MQIAPIDEYHVGHEWRVGWQVHEASPPACREGPSRPRCYAPHRLDTICRVTAADPERPSPSKQGNVGLCSARAEHRRPRASRRAGASHAETPLHDVPPALQRRIAKVVDLDPQRPTGGARRRGGGEVASSTIVGPATPSVGGLPSVAGLTTNSTIISKSGNHAVAILQ